MIKPDTLFSVSGFYIKKKATRNGRPSILILNSKY